MEFHFPFLFMWPLAFCFLFCLCCLSGIRILLPIFFGLPASGLGISFSFFFLFSFFLLNNYSWNMGSSLSKGKATEQPPAGTSAGLMYKNHGP